jgi:hypothetical protein
MMARTWASSCGKVTDHQAALAVGIPLLGHQARHVLVQRLAIDFQELQVGTAGIGGTRHSTITPRSFHSRRDRVPAHVGADRDDVGVIALEGFAGILFGGGADVTALGIEHQRDLGVVGAQVGADALQLLFRTEGSE